MDKVGRPLGFKMSEESKKKTSESMAGRRLSKQHKKNISVSRKKKYAKIKLEKPIKEMENKLDKL